MRTEPSRSSVPFPGFGNLLLLWLLLGVVGGILGWLGYSHSKSDRFIIWKPYAPAPSIAAAKIMEGDPFEVKIQDASGMILKWDNQDKEWIVDKLAGESKLINCDSFPQAFSAENYPPEGIRDCAAFEGYGGELTYLVLFAIDQPGEIWQWRRLHHGMEFLVYPLMALRGALLGMATGSGIWSLRILWLLLKKQQARTIPGEAATPQDKPTIEAGEASTSQAEAFLPKERTGPPVGLWVLAVLPWLCLMFVGGYPISVLPMSPQEVQATRASQRELLNKQFPEVNAEWYQSLPLAPNPTGPAYDLVTLCESALWFTNDEPMKCAGETSLWGKPSVKTVTYTEPGQAGESQALMLTLPQYTKNIVSGYPVWEIRTGDHFQATLACPSNKLDCNLIYHLYLKEAQGSLILLDNGRLTTEETTVDIDVDLSANAGRLVSFILWTVNPVSDSDQQIALWIRPRIETAP